MTGAEFSEVDVDLLADYVGGALTGTPDEAAVAALIAGDPAWQTAHDELAGAMASVGAELSALGAVSDPMPAELVVRLDAAFASAVALDPAAPAAASGVTSGAGAASGRHLSAVPDDGVDRGVGKRKRTTAGDRRRPMRWAVPIAAAAGVIAFVGVGINYLSDQPRSDSQNASSAAGSGELKDSSGIPELGPNQADAAAGTQILASGRDYQLTTLASAADSGMTAKAGSPRSESSQASVPRPLAGSSLDRLALGDALQACLDAIARQNAAGPIIAPVVDYARFDGNPALIVRFTAQNGSWVWATGPDCGLAGSDAAKLGSVKVG